MPVIDNHRLPQEGYVPSHSFNAPVTDEPTGSVSISPQIGGQKLLLDKDTLAPSGTSITDFLPNTEITKQESDAKKVSPYYADSMAPHPDKNMRKLEELADPTADATKSQSSGFFGFFGAAAAAALNLMGDVWQGLKNTFGGGDSAPVETTPDSAITPDSPAVAPDSPATLAGIGSAIYEATIGNVYKASQWVWGLINGTPAAVSETEINKVIGADKATDVKKMINGLHPFINKVTRDYIAEMNDAKSFDQMIIQVMKNYVNNDKEILQSMKENSLTKKHEQYKKAQDDYVKEIKAFRESAKNNKFWKWTEDLASTAGLVTAAASAGFAGTPIGAITLAVILGSYVDKHMGDKVGKMVADGFSSTFSTGTRESKANCLNYLKTGIASLSILYSFGNAAVLGASKLSGAAQGVSSVLNGATAIGKAIHESSNENHQAQVIELNEKMQQSEKKLQGSVKEIQHMVELIQKAFQQMGKDLVQGQNEVITNLFRR